MRNPIQKIIPSNFNNLFGLAKKLFRSKNPAGRAAMLYSLLGLVLIPLDWTLQFFEKKIYLKSGKPELPILFVCGPPRSGTTLVAQVLIKYLPVYYFNNLTSIFPNTPIVSNKIFRRFKKEANQRVSFKSLYGRTTKLWAPNDALYLWDRWTGVARDEVPQAIRPEDKVRMQRFFGAVEQFSGKSLVNKNNKLNSFAYEVSKVLDTAYFICLDRDPVYLAQSLLIASRFIHGDEKIPYGVRFDSLGGQVGDPVAQVCHQVLLHKQLMLRQKELIGDERFIIIPYEDFCADPAKWVYEIADNILGQPMDIEALRSALPPFQVSNKTKLDQETFNKIHIEFNNPKNAK